MSYEVVKLSEVCNFLNGGTPSRQVARYFEGDIPWITSADLADDQDVVTHARFYITEEAIQSSATKIIPKDNILLVSRTCVGKVAITGSDICISQDFTGIVPDKSRVNLRYLFRFLQASKTHFVYHQRGATIQGITRQVIAELPIPLPPLAEQQRIAAILDQADMLRAKRRTAVARLDALLQSTFLHLFGDPVTNPMGWPVGKIGDLAIQVNYGTSQKAGEQGEFPILRMGNITYEGGWDFSDLKYVDFGEKEQDKYLVYKGHILFNRTNSKELVGKTAVYRENQPMAFAGYLVRMITNDKADPEYVSAFMNTPHTKKYLQEKCKSIVGMANINAKEFQAIPIPMPPVALQQEYAAFVQKSLAMKAKLLKGARIQANLFHALQQRAFKGEL